MAKKIDLSTVDPLRAKHLQRQRVRDRARYEKNREKKLAYKKAYRAANKEKIAVAHAEYRRSNLEKERERVRVYNEKNKEKIAARSKARRESRLEAERQSLGPTSAFQLLFLTAAAQAKKLEQKARALEKSRLRHAADKENLNTCRKERYHRTKEVTLQRQRAVRSKQRANLDPRYVKDVLRGAGFSQIPNELIAAKTEQLAISRLNRQLTKAIKEVTP